MLGMGLGMWLTAMFVATWLSASWKRRVVGFGLTTDIMVHITLQTLFGGDATGRAGMLLAGILINFTMHTYRRLYGWETLRRGKWVRYAGSLT